MDLNTLWFVLITVLLAGYAVLDGFDLGVGILHLFTRDDHERRLYINAIAPVWDGNEVWLLTGAGAIFAAFPPVYATVFSGFYIALMLLLAALIFRAVAMEFRGKVDSLTWRRIWDWALGVGSLLPAILFGVALGNILRGVPINAAGDFTGSFLGLLNPYAILVGLLTLAGCLVHGAVYLTVKTDGATRDRLVRWIPSLWAGFLLLFVIATLATFYVSPFLFTGLMARPICWIVPAAVLAAAILTFRAIRSASYATAWLTSSIMIGLVVVLAALSLYPRMVPSLTDLNNSLTAYNSASTPRTLSAMLVIALLGVPMVLIYTICIYRIFRGNVVLDEHSY
jgi:cytochrome d ubiquinol oxidase subunit II